MRLAITIMVIALVASMTCSCFAGANQSVKAAVHVRAHNAKIGCNVTIATCADIVTTEAGFSVDAFAVFYDLEEFLGVQYGFTWPAAWGTATFTSCSDLVIDSVTNPGDGAAHTWTDCQSASVAVAGYIWLYASAPGQISLVDYPNSGPPGLYALDCSEGLDWPHPCIFGAGVYGASGADPCSTCTPSHATDPTTWSEIKSIFK